MVAARKKGVINFLFWARGLDDQLPLNFSTCYLLVENGGEEDSSLLRRITGNYFS